MKQGSYPQIFKLAKVTALFKGGIESEADNYRPISVLPVLNKVLEKIIHQQLVHFLELHNVLSKQQFGFRKKHSTSHAISCLHEKLINNFENSKMSAVLFIDLKSAFDTIDIDILLKKMEHYGFRNNVLTLLSKFLLLIGNSMLTVVISNLKFSLCCVEFRRGVSSDLFFLYCI